MVKTAAHDSLGRFVASSNNEEMASKKANDSVGEWQQWIIMMVDDGNGMMLCHQEFL